MSKSQIEMNSKANQIRPNKHNFNNQDLEEVDFKQEPERPRSAAPRGEYMKNTVSTDLKKGMQATTQKSK